MVIWTRVTPATAVLDVEGSWEISEYEDFHEVAARGAFSTSPSNDYTVKIDVQGLQPARYYYYRFHALDATSPTGRTKTAPAGDTDSLKFAVVSCSNWEFGYFNAYDCIADREVDVVLHLGDFIYEYGTGQYGDSTIGRTVLPPFEIISLRDYRTRYSQYRLDEGLRNLSARHPMISIWDDHEIANNSYSEGAQNHQDDEGPYSDRREAAKKAYYEWLPIREGGKHYRSFNYGSLAEVIMLDERLEGRTRPPESTSDTSYASPDRHMLGEEQLSWFETRLIDSTAQWKVIGNQVIFSEVDQSRVYPKSPRNLDSWDGYPAERKRIVAYIRDKRIDDIIFVTGDTHASWAFEVAPDPMHSYDAMTGVRLPLPLSLAPPVCRRRTGMNMKPQIR
ncbi:MAG: hypothetical protein HC859_12090 [Bacteroidia bacterium]|nr:hypothetical protein [Bacteroidia bacterium]